MLRFRFDQWFKKHRFWWSMRHATVLAMLFFALGFCFGAFVIVGVN